MSASGAEPQPWVSCFLTDILIRHIERHDREGAGVDYPHLFRVVDGLETPADPRAFLTDVANWVPLPVLRELNGQCERLAGRKDVAYLAARSYFDPERESELSLLGILFRVLHDVRSVLICASLWAGVHTTYLKLQSFETSAAHGHVGMLAQFLPPVAPTLGSLHLLRGYAEGFARLCPGIQDLACVEEMSQLRIQDVVGEFSDFAVEDHGDRLLVVRRLDGSPVAAARRVVLRAEAIPVSPEFAAGMPEEAVVPPEDGRLAVLTPSDAGVPREGQCAYRIESGGTLSEGGLAYRFECGAVLNAPYSRFGFRWRETGPPARTPSVESVRHELSALLFGYLRQARRTQMRIAQHSVDKRTLTLENIRLRQEIEREYGFAGLVGQGAKMQALFGLVRSLAGTDVSVLIQGETGTGKELIARAIHHHSARRGRRFLAVNCGAIPETLLESELFGHEKGAFTGAAGRRLGVFELADGGTLFLDEVGEISPATQVRLLRVLQEGEFQRVGGTAPIRVNVRILSATNQDLEELVRRGRFRQDLYYRLKVFPLLVPPLRERPEDIPLLVGHFVATCNRRMQRGVRHVTPQVMAVLVAHAWPGNVRELENVIQRMMVLATGDTLDVDSLPAELQGVQREEPVPRGLKGVARQTASVAERAAVQDALQKTAGNVTRAAKLLGISRATLQKRMKLFGLRSGRE
jgi:DNA-binding NtrC family response regulator